ncbi:CUN061 hypothetical protein [Culex nigripalpus nucleopolyhedrovirus]|uniref:Uncharacterized protein n=1 Tax=Culex nigripalpus nucleopolyhedrovirus (isolate Florida/1997) TaxID=645993 RepID=Q919L5_NPVCO|nr:CUN061 hypothetical protein [Culex nigripalpus nucleopolyhedrovirus]AAK94139.1 CUN061 hypothetical protein [Culex nigripalpus nucleopolyhedrovirus]
MFIEVIFFFFIYIYIYSKAAQLGGRPVEMYTITLTLADATTGLTRFVRTYDRASGHIDLPEADGLRMEIFAQAPPNHALDINGEVYKFEADFHQVVELGSDVTKFYAYYHHGCSRSTVILRTIQPEKVEFIFYPQRKRKPVCNKPQV